MDRPVRAAGERLASGRDSDIFEYGDHQVLRRSRAGRSMEGEARTMEYARALGYPVPAVGEVSDDGTQVVMERIQGPLLLAALGRRPWTIGRYGALLADLHERLHQIPAPDWVADAPCGPGDRLVHLDLHPLNVILSPGGPVVIDWSNAARGAAEVDVALTWVLLASGDNPARGLKGVLTDRFRAGLIRAFVAPFETDPIRKLLPQVVEWKTTDAHMSEAEKRAMRSLAQKFG
jgi:tRNA A-37 threonylcarbamoyl transferase component Bud32